MLYMSPEHVSAMNEILVDNETVRAACAELEGPVAVGYLLHDGPDGADVHWRMRLDKTVTFGLDDGPADLLLEGDWARMIEMKRASTEGRAYDPELSFTGRLELLPQLLQIISTAGTVATLPTELPR